MSEYALLVRRGNGLTTPAVAAILARLFAQLARRPGLRMSVHHAMTRAMVRRAPARWLALAAALVLTGCGEDDRPASFEYIHTAILASSCATASCHSEEVSQAGVRLDTVESAYTMLVGRPCDADDIDEQAPRNFVDPGHPERSRLMYLLRGEEVRRAMPPDRFLPEPDIELVERWILEGAPCN